MQDDLAGLIDRTICGFSDRVILQMDVHEDDRRLEQICDEVRAELTAALETLTRERDEARAEVERAFVERDGAGYLGTSLAETIKDQAEELRTLRTQLTATQARLDEAVGVITALRKDIDDLVCNSTGVAGLHMNGDLADWSSLLPDGEFGGWLGSVSGADTFLAQQEGQSK